MEVDIDYHFLNESDRKKQSAMANSLKDEVRRNQFIEANVPKLLLEQLEFLIPYKTNY